MKRKILAIFLSMLILSSTFATNLNVYAGEQDKDYVEITEKSAKWTDIDNYLAEVLIKVKGRQAVEPVDVVICLDKSGSMDMNFLMPSTSAAIYKNTPFASCPCLNQDHFYLNKKMVDGVEVVASFDGPEPSQDSLIYDSNAQTLTVYDQDTSKWTVLDTSNEVHKYYIFAVVDVYPYHFKKDANGNYKRISKWNTNAEVPFWDHADENDGCFDRWGEAQSAVKEFSKSVLDANSNNKVALVPFSQRDAYKEFYVDWTRDINAIDTKIDSLQTTVSTDYIYALGKAYDMLDQRSAEDKATKKAVVVFISDGVPDPQNTTNRFSDGSISAFYNLPAHVYELANAIKGDENWTPDPSLVTSFWNARTGTYQRHDVQRTDIVGMGAKIITMAIMIEDNQTSILQGMASDPRLFYNLNAEQFSSAKGVLEKELLSMTLLPAGRETVLTDKISEYFTVDESKLSDKLQCITDPNTGEQTIVWDIGDIYDEEMSIKIPLILKEEYRKDQTITYYPTNKDTDVPGAKINYKDPFDKHKEGHHVTPKLPYEKASSAITPLGWMRSIESADTSFIVPRSGNGDEWSFNEALFSTPIRYFENKQIYNAALEQKAKGNECISDEESLFGDSHIWDEGTYFDKYKMENGNVNYSWASWKHWGVDGEKDLDNAEYSVRRFSAYVDINQNQYDSMETALLAPTDEVGNMSYLFPVNDSVYVFINGTLVYWGGTDVDGSSNQYGADYKSAFSGVQGIQLRNGVNGLFKNIYPHTDGWCIDLEANKDKMNIKSLLKPGVNRIDIFANDYWEGGGMNKINLFTE